jgi:hypothetical protein
LSSSEIISCKECDFKTKDFKVQMYDRNIIAATFLLLLISLFVTLNNNTSEVTIPDPVFAQVKGGLSTSSVNPNSTIGERTGNTTGDLTTGGTSAASVADGLDRTMSSSESTGNTTNLTSTEGGLSASSVNNAGKE